ncbi:MAG: peptide deformylase [Spirochaetaceae bacterium]|nr:peptide deformylase [Spirochaetaceae bacterium]
MNEVHMDVVKIGAELLLRKAKAIDTIDERSVKMIEAMIETLHAEGGVGLAGPQVGVSERLFVIDIDGKTPRAFINPSILETSEDTVLIEEGCLSIPGVWAEVRRPRTVRVQAWNERGRPFTIEADGLLARVIQHEYDHLEGILFIDRISPVKRERLLVKYQKQRAKH